MCKTYTGHADWVDPLTGWASGSDPMGREGVNFDTMEQAIAYAKAQNMNFEIRGDTSKNEATLEKRDKIQVYDHNFLGPAEMHHLKKYGGSKSTIIWDFEAPGKSYWTNDQRKDYGPDKWVKGFPKQ
jgi:hypothetical protein